MQGLAGALGVISRVCSKCGDSYLAGDAQLHQTSQACKLGTALKATAATALAQAEAC